MRAIDNRNTQGMDKESKKQRKLIEGQNNPHIFFTIQTVFRRVALLKDSPSVLNCPAEVRYLFLEGAQIFLPHQIREFFPELTTHFSECTAIVFFFFVALCAPLLLGR